MNYISASTGNGGLKILGMNLLFQTNFLLYVDFSKPLSFLIRKYNRIFQKSKLNILKTRLIELRPQSKGQLAL